MNMRSTGLLLILIIFTTIISPLFAQDITGIWRGYFTTSYGEEYKLEFQVAQTKTLSATGVSYSYLDKRFYGKATMKGYFTKTSKTFQIQELRTVEVKNLEGNGTCLMNYRLTYSRSGKEEMLEGIFVAKTEDRSNPKNNGKWGDCSGGKVFLRKVSTSEFYVEPFLRDKPTVKKPAIQPKTNPNTKTATTKPPITKPIAKVPAAKTPIKTTTTKTQNKPPVTTKAPVAKPKTVDTKKSIPVIAKEEPQKSTPVRTVPQIPAITRSRTNELVQTINVQSEEIVVRLYDNGEIDGDTISVYLDNKLVLASKRLTAAPLTITLKKDKDDVEHVLVMVAENLGSIPPNTSLMVVYDGEKRYHVRITSTEQKNAMVRFRYQK
ncbi:MAG: hypothetical protein ABR502_03835 [Chitinophagaceae bacterium]